MAMVRDMATVVMMALSCAGIFNGGEAASTDQVDPGSVPETGVQTADSAVSSPETRFFTIEELARYNGIGGNPAYVAVDGVVYDVTGVRAWKKGKHRGHPAGTDISELIRKKSPHGARVLKKRKMVGKLAAGDGGTAK